MLEHECKRSFETICRNEIDEINSKTFVGLRGWPRPKERFTDFFDDGSLWTKWDGYIIKRANHAQRSKGDAFDAACRYFWHSENMLRAYVSKRYGDLATAMEETRTFGVLFDTFLSDFEKEREKLMSKTSDLIAQQVGGLRRQGKMPQSHGGVANLLKVLTATMKAQGSSIKTIAKVQYTVCLQAGIYVPEEFITDVLVAANMEEGK